MLICISVLSISVGPLSVQLIGIKSDMWSSPLLGLDHHSSIDSYLPIPTRWLLRYANNLLRDWVTESDNQHSAEPVLRGSSDA